MSIKGIWNGMKTATLVVTTGYLFGLGFYLANSLNKSKEYMDGYTDGITKCTEIVDDMIKEREGVDA